LIVFRKTCALLAFDLAEHFNIPWHQAIEDEAFAKAGVEVEWVMEPLGTGAMINHLKSGTADIVVALTEVGCFLFQP
jgi:ABC-type nitrate/sulfonate/bicarbonate transport system substrate-binding protein